jgi:hypothetical protein
MSAHANGMRWVFQAHGEEKGGKKVSEKGVRFIFKK